MSKTPKLQVIEGGGPEPHRRSIDRFVFVYFVRVDRFIKIGFSRQWKKRVANMRTTCPHEVEVLHVELNEPTYEASLHRRFRHLHHRGEWFQADQEILDYIAKRAADRRDIRHHKISAWGIKKQSKDEP